MAEGTKKESTLDTSPQRSIHGRNVGSKLPGRGRWRVDAEGLPTVVSLRSEGLISSTLGLKRTIEQLT